MINKEFDIEQIDLISKLLLKILFPDGVDRMTIDRFDFDENLVDLKLKLKKLIEENCFCKANELLVAEIEKNEHDSNILQIAVWFYLKLNEFDDETLHKHGFSRHEVVEGFKKIENLVMQF